ncbi:MAG: hypothetical protein HC875_14365 [Anaerolineales bacterium]|nr:hypothetical protein [Anaerolineales bacterium]
MEQIVVQVRDKEKAKVLFELLTALDFVDSVKTSETEEVEVKATVQEELSDFFSLAGLWQDREITLESIRQKAWPRQYS